MSENHFNPQNSAPLPDANPAPRAYEPVTRRYPSTPLVGVAAAVFNPMGRVLLVQRGRPPGAGEWALPGGLLELGETLADGARREVREECGIEIEVGGIVGAFEPIHRDKDGRIEYHFVVVDFWAAHTAGDVSPADDALAAVWATMEELEPYRLKPDTRQIVWNAYQAWSDERSARGLGTTPEPGATQVRFQPDPRV